MYSCDVCDLKFETVYHLLQHQKYDHEKWGTVGDDSVDDNEEMENSLDKEEVNETDDEKEEAEKTFDPLNDIDFKSLYQKRDRQARKYERLYKSKLNESKQHLERIHLFEKQLDEFRTNFNDTKFNEFSDTIINAKNIRNYLELQRLIDLKSFKSITRSNKLLKAIKNLFTGLKYGAVPLVVSQTKRLNAKGRKLIRVVDCKSLEEIKRLLLNHSKDFYNIFQIIGRTLSLISSLECDNTVV
eukprot:sb/3469039/